MTIEQMPRRGQALKSGGYTKTVPRSWTDEEISWIQEKRLAGMRLSEMAEALDRSEVSIQVKLKRLGKTKDTYNSNHRDLKYAANESFFSQIQPSSVLDLYAGNSWYLDRVSRLITNDTDTKFNTDYHENAEHLIHRLWLDKSKFDLIDLDPYGSAYECFLPAIKMAQKGLVVSFGEWGHLRWKRLDFVRDRYGIEELEDFTIDKFIDEICRIGRTQKKELVLLDSLQYGNFLRCYFQIKPYKVTEQWEG